MSLKGMLVSLLLITADLVSLSILRLLTDITTKSVIQHPKGEPSLLCVEGR